MNLYRAQHLPLVIQGLILNCNLTVTITILPFTFPCKYIFSHMGYFNAPEFDPGSIPSRD